MCDLLNLDIQPPVKQFEMAAHALDDFKRDQGSWEKFEAVDWLVRVLSAKWGAYALARRVNACREDNGNEHDEIVELSG
jgi:hypothetical protein